VFPVGPRGPREDRVSCLTGCEGDGRRRISRRRPHALEAAGVPALTLFASIDPARRVVIANAGLNDAFAGVVA
jgi:hypothetical protein